MDDAEDCRFVFLYLPQTAQLGHLNRLLDVYQLVSQRKLIRTTTWTDEAGVEFSYHCYNSDTCSFHIRGCCATRRERLDCHALFCSTLGLQVDMQSRRWLDAVKICSRVDARQAKAGEPRGRLCEAILTPFVLLLSLLFAAGVLLAAFVLAYFVFVPANLVVNVRFLECTEAL